ncbi:MAG: two-component sensor histidine kinase [Hyphomicrobiales bacterium]|nr:two-component sensor histidine kinase [Hyphomicrobiales bacterium]
MAAIDDEKGARSAQWRRLLAARVPVLTAALLFGGFWIAGLLAATPALLGLLLMAAASVIVTTRTESESVMAPNGAPAGLRLSSASLEGLLAGLPDPVVAVAIQDEVVAFNAPATTVAAALRRGEQVSLALRMPEVLEAIRRARATGKAQRVEFSEHVPLDRWYDAVVTPIPAVESGLLLLAFHDLTPLRRVEQMRADFIANASHELRTPLAALSGFIDTLQGPAREDPAARERFLAIMQAQATRMARLIDDLLSLSRIELNAHLRPDKQVDLVAIVRQVADGLQTLARDRGVEIRMQLPEKPVPVLGDRDELIRVLENLVENALKYAASGKRVEVDLSLAAGRGAREARLAVRDYGPGIAPEHLPRLTERFYRVDVVESRAQGGTGLGLALAKHILNRHHGRLTIESTAGQGATFVVHLPLQAPASELAV